jgi:hypothetical protein
VYLPFKAICSRRQYVRYEFIDGILSFLLPAVLAAQTAVVVIGFVLSLQTADSMKQIQGCAEECNHSVDNFESLASPRNSSA